MLTQPYCTIPRRLNFPLDGAGAHPPSVLPLFLRMRLMWRRPSSTVRCGHASSFRSTTFPVHTPNVAQAFLDSTVRARIFLLFYPFSLAYTSCSAGLPRQYFADTHPSSVLPIFPCMRLMWCGPSSTVLCRHASFFCSTHFPAHAPHVAHAFLDGTVRACILLLFYPFCRECTSCGAGVP